MTTNVFSSSLAKRLSDFCQYKRLQNYDYYSQTTNLRCFDKFITRKGFGEIILTRSIVEKYILFLKDYSPISGYNRLSTLGVFSRYLHLYETESYVFHEIPMKKPKCLRYYIFSDDNIKALLQGCSSLQTKRESIRVQTYKTLFSLMYCTGIRVNEALSLTLGDLYLQKSLLFIGQGKFGKDRWISLSASSIRAINCYVIIRQHYCPGKQDAPLFMNRFRRKLNYKQVRRAFRNIIDKYQIGKMQSKKNIRLHDLRHTYASNCLLKWYQSGEDVNSKLPLLATAMGHVNISSTQIYLHTTEQIRSHAQQRFYRKFQEKILKEGV